MSTVEWLAIFLTLLAALGLMGRLTTDSKPTRESFRVGGIEPQLQVAGYLAPYLAALAAILWGIFGLLHAI